SQRMMDDMITGVDWNVGKDYLDDVIIGSKTFEEHLNDLQKLFNRLREFGLSIKLVKCKFFQEKLSYLGHEVSSTGIQPGPAKISAVTKMQPPTDISGLRRFLGM